MTGNLRADIEALSGEHGAPNNAEDDYAAGWEHALGAVLDLLAVPLIRDTDAILAAHQEAPSADVEASIRLDERSKAYREWFLNDPMLSRGYWFVPCDDGCVDGVYTDPEGRGEPCIRCRGTGYTLLSMADPNADAILAAHPAEESTEEWRGPENADGEYISGITRRSVAPDGGPAWVRHVTPWVEVSDRG